MQEIPKNKSECGKPYYNATPEGFRSGSVSQGTFRFFRTNMHRYALEFFRRN